MTPFTVTLNFSGERYRVHGTASPFRAAKTNCPNEDARPAEGGVEEITEVERDCSTPASQLAGREKWEQCDMDEVGEMLFKPAFVRAVEEAYLEEYEAAKADWS